MSFLKRLGARIGATLKPTDFHGDHDLQHPPTPLDDKDAIPSHFGMADLVAQQAALSQPAVAPAHTAPALAVTQEEIPPSTAAPAQSFIHYIGLFDNLTVVINDIVVAADQIADYAPEDVHPQEAFRVTAPDGTTHVFWNNPSDLKKDFIRNVSHTTCIELGDMRGKTFSIDICTIDAVSLGLAFPTIDFSAATPLPNQVHDSLPYAHGRRGSYNPRKAVTAQKPNKPVIL